MKLADEALFKRLLLLERRRSERTGSRFAVMLVDMKDLATTFDAEAMDKIGQAIGAKMRETDIIGWYQNSSVLGVILTTLNGASRRTLENVVVARTRSVLSLQPVADYIQQVWISCHIFPDDENTGTQTPDGMFDSTRDGETRVTNSKRVIDIAGSLMAIVALSPAFVVISALVKLTSQGPVLFKQRRIGESGQEFTFLKFRSMFVNSDPSIHREYVRKLITQELSETGGTYKITNDPRVTAVGKFLRKTSLDELPQFFNVLKGDMSLVGPRPPIPYEMEKYSLWHRRRVLEAKPGITGIWQIYGRSRTTFDEMVRMDLRYVREQSLWLDIKLLFKTPLAVARGRGAF
jgi:lipopolysaccharide/colanic/teichoic acid biosynthesis glycosyltransferase